MPAASSSATASRSATASPEIVTFSGPLMLAITARSPNRASRSATSRAGARTAAIAPAVGSDWINRARSATNRSPSSSENTPATHAAASSPTLWPRIASGITPHDRQSSASATSIANSAGCAYRVSSSADGGDGRKKLRRDRRTGATSGGMTWPLWPFCVALPAGGSGYSSDSSGRSRWRRSTASQRSSVARNVGWLWNSWRAIPTCCAPSPVNSHATLGGLCALNSA